jgi:hypothetical protein
MLLKVCTLTPYLAVLVPLCQCECEQECEQNKIRQHHDHRNRRGRCPQRIQAAYWKFLLTIVSRIVPQNNSNNIEKKPNQPCSKKVSNVRPSITTGTTSSGGRWCGGLALLGLSPCGPWWKWYRCESGAVRVRSLGRHVRLGRLGLAHILC